MPMIRLPIRCSLPSRFSFHRFLRGILFLLCAAVLFIVPAMAGERIDLTGPGWALWLDKDASYEDDMLYLPPVNLSVLPVNPPSRGWDAIPAEERLEVSVPGTVEEYYWDELGDYQGVSWWMREITLPSGKDSRVKLCFEAVRLRCEVYIDHKLVGYDLVGNTPFEIDITDHVNMGGNHRLALRITDPGGNFDWIDYTPFYWGRFKVPASHGFGGVTGNVSLDIHDEVYIKDIFIKNKPSIKEVDVEITLSNEGVSECPCDLELHVDEANRIPGENSDAPLKRLIDTIERKVIVKPGDKTVKLTLAAPEARPWDLDSPALYMLYANLRCEEKKLEDAAQQRFGFRWFEVDGHKKDAVFRLNGKRVVLRSAISWGFWPVNGIYPTTKELTKRHVAVAKELGLNMLHFHRGIGWRAILDEADEQGLLYYEEPGGYTAQGGARFAWAWARHKLLRMVKRDRNHPSLVIYNMINEQAVAPMAHHKQDMRDAHALDPTRIITYVSGWAEEGDDPFKLHMLPYDDSMYLYGWYDCHHAPGPGVYLNEHYNHPKDHNLFTENKEEIVFYGEEGAIGAPPRLHAMQEHFAKAGRPGWDGTDYRKWLEAYQSYFEAKDFSKYFPTVDGLIEMIGNVALEYHGRMIESIRANDWIDGYVINGFEGEKLENHSGIVDAWRQVKGDKEILAHYNQTLYLAVKVRDMVLVEGGETFVDLFIINEENVNGPHTLDLHCTPPGGNGSIRLFEGEVQIDGGDRYGQLLAEAIPLRLEAGHGHYELSAKLTNAAGEEVASGRERAFAVPQWRNIPISGRGAIIEWEGEIDRFIKEQKGLEVPAYKGNMGKLDYVIIDRGYRPKAEPIGAAHRRTPDGEEGLKLDYFEGMNFEKLKGTTVVENVYYLTNSDPVSDQVGKKNFSLRWTGTMIPPETGHYLIVTRSHDGVRLWIDGKLEVDNWTQHLYESNWASLELEAGRAYDVRLEYFQVSGAAGISLEWIPPGADWVNLPELLMRVKNHGTTLIILQDTPLWAKKISLFRAFEYHGEMRHQRAWLGGSYFVREHPFFAGLPVNCAMNWEYQSLVRYDNRTHSGLIMDNEEAVVASVTGHEHQVATSLGIVPVGKGRIVLSTLSMVQHLNAQDHASETVKLIFCNMLADASKPKAANESKK